MRMGVPCAFCQCCYAVCQAMWSGKWCTVARSEASELAATTYQQVSLRERDWEIPNNHVNPVQVPCIKQAGQRHPHSHAPQLQHRCRPYVSPWIPPTEPHWLH